MKMLNTFFKIKCEKRKGKIKKETKMIVTSFFLLFKKIQKLQRKHKDNTEIAKKIHRHYRNCKENNFKKCKYYKQTRETKQTAREK